MRFLPAILLIVLAIYCLIEIAQSDPHEVRQLPRSLWALVVLVPLVGPIGWLVYGRPNGDEPVPATPRKRPHLVAPDDDPEFLRNLKIDPPDHD
ncbi:MAG: PLD nuclease N-terminal domain-containing protein [Nocardioidaceae bacterium]